MSKGLMRITNHPRQDDFVVLKFPPDLNSIIRSLGPAQQAFDLGGYVLAREHMDTLKNWARYNAVTLLDESRAKSEPTKPVECGNQIEVTLMDKTITEECCAPYQAGKVPKFCGSCGQTSKPIHFDDGEPVVGVKCPGCSKVNHGAAFCTSCGSALPDRHMTTKRRRKRPKSEPRQLTADDLPPQLSPAVSSVPGVSSR